MITLILASVLVSSQITVAGVLLYLVHTPNDSKQLIKRKY